VTIFLTILAVLAGLLGGFWAGFALGGNVRGRPKRFWALNAAVVVVAMLADFTGLVMGWPPLAYGALGIMGGALTGLKYGYSESIGVWRVIDEAAGIGLPEPAEDPEAQDGPAAE